MMKSMIITIVSDFGRSARRSAAREHDRKLFSSGFQYSTNVLTTDNFLGVVNALSVFHVPV